MPEPHVLILGRDDDTTRMLYHALVREVGVLSVITEDKIPASVVAKRRAKKLGWFSVIGQMLFVKLVVPYLSRRGHGRAAAIQKKYGLTTDPYPEGRHLHVSNINDREVLQKITQLQPTHVVVNGTRLISSNMIDAITVPLINIHLGWNPRYRGGNGGYWALMKDDAAHCGTTVHLIDAGVDTGGVLARVRVEPTKEDNFTTYPLLQLAAGISALVPLLRTKTLSPVGTDSEPSALWYHPTLWGYLWHRVRNGVR